MRDEKHAASPVGKGPKVVEGVEWAEKVPTDLPILNIAGDQDPVGEMGKGVRRAYQAFRKAGVRDVSIKLYHGLRHEILNEASRRYVYQDVLDWLETRAERADKASSSVS